MPNGNRIFTCSSLEFLFLLAAIYGHLLRIRLPLRWSFLRRKRLPIGKPEISGTRKSVQYKSMIGNIDIHFIHWWRIEWQTLCSSTTGRKRFDILDPIPCLVPRRAGHRSTIPFRRIHRPDWLPRRFEVFHAISAAIAIRIFYPDYSPIPSRRFFAEWKIWAKPSHRIWIANFSISDNACRKESVLFSKRGFSDGESGQRYSEYSVFHSRFSGSNCQFGAK